MVDNQAARMDGVFHALSDQTRRAILVRLAAGECNVGELAEPFDMSLAAVSKHIKVLEDTGLVEKVKDGRTFRCRPKFDRLGDAYALLQELADYWQGRLAALDEFLSNEAPHGNTGHGKQSSATGAHGGRKEGHPRKKR